MVIANQSQVDNIAMECMLAHLVGTKVETLSLNGSTDTMKLFGGLRVGKHGQECGGLVGQGGGVGRGCHGGAAW